MDLNFGYVAGDGALEFGYTGAFVGGPDLTAPATLTEGETATITLSGNSAAPTEARLNGTVMALTDAGGGDYTFTVPRLPDDATAELQVDVDGYTLPATVDYSNAFPYANTQHGEPHPLSALYQANLATTDPFEIRITSDTDPAVMTVDWAQIDADGAWLDDITPYITLASGLESGTASATIEFYLHEDGSTVSRTVTIEDLGPNGTVTIDNINASRNAATISFSYDRTDLTGYEYSIDEGATTVSTSNPAELTGLTSETTYDFWIRAVNADGPGIWAKTTFTTSASVDTTPNQFTFAPQTDVARNVTVTSNSITVQGVDAGLDIPISVSGDPGSEYSVSTDGGSAWGGWTSAPTNVRLNYQVRVRHTSSDEYSSGGYDGERQTSLNIGGTVGTFDSTTLADTVAPVISLTGGNQTIVQGSTWTEPGYEAIDNADGDISVSGVAVTGTVDTSTPGEYTLTYTATDASGNQSSTNRRVTVTEFVPEDTVAPVITLNGGNQTIVEGGTWTEPGYSATDNVDGNLTGSVQVTGTVNTANPGNYPLTYSVVDAAGNVGTATRTVTVQPLVQYPFNSPAPAKRTVNADRPTRPEMGVQTFVMQAGEVLDYDFNLTQWLADQGDDSIDPGNFTVTELSDAITVMDSGQVTDTDRIKVWVRADAIDESHAAPVQLTVTTDGQRTASFQMLLILIDRMH